ncbi:MAG: alpha/beta hydrolase, partial [Litorimonas sp.]
AVLSGTLSPSAVICSAPMLGLMDLDTALLRNGIRALSALGLSRRNLPFQKQRGGLPVAFADNKLTSDRERYARWASFFQNTPRLRVGEPTFGWIAAALNSMAFVNRNAAQLGIPGLMVAAGGDQIVDPASIQGFAERAGCDYHVVPGAKHELFLERDPMRNAFFDAIDGFLEEQAL